MSIKKRLGEENIFVFLPALYNLATEKHHEEDTVVDLARRSRKRKVIREMMNTRSRDWGLLRKYSFFAERISVLNNDKNRDAPILPA